MGTGFPPVGFTPVSPYTLEAVTLVYVVEMSVSCYAVVVFEFVRHTLGHLSVLTLWYVRRVVGTPFDDRLTGMNLSVAMRVFFA